MVGPCKASLRVGKPHLKAKQAFQRPQAKPLLPDAFVHTADRLRGSTGPSARLCQLPASALAPPPFWLCPLPSSSLPQLFDSQAFKARPTSLPPPGACGRRKRESLACQARPARRIFSCRACRPPGSSQARPLSTALLSRRPPRPLSSAAAGHFLCCPPVPPPPLRLCTRRHCCSRCNAAHILHSTALRQLAACATFCTPKLALLCCRCKAPRQTVATHAALLLLATCADCAPRLLRTSGSPTWPRNNGSSLKR